MKRENNWPPQFGFDPGLPADHQGMNDPGLDDECGCTDLSICAYHEANGIDLEEEIIDEE